MFEQLQSRLATPGLLWVSDCKMSALGTRAAIQTQHHYYLTVLPRTETTVNLMADLLAQAQVQGEERLQVVKIGPKAEAVLLATGYQFTRSQQEPSTAIAWEERVLLVHSDNYQQQQQRGFEQRLQRATDKLHALTPAMGRGKRQIREEATLLIQAQAILKQYRLDGLLHYTYECQTSPKTGKVRYQMTTVVPQWPAITQHQQLFGWRMYVTNAPAPRLTFAEAVLAYRDEWIIERGFGRYKGEALSVSPLLVRRDDPVQGLLHLLSLLKAFDNLTLTVFEVDNQIYGHVSPLSDLQQQILSLLAG